MVRILYVEDDGVLARTVVQVFRDEGWVVDLAYEGASGLRYAEERSYDFALIDWMLPGRAAAERGNSAARATPLARVSSELDPGEQR